MGYGGWDRGTYDRTTRANVAAGRDTFEYGRTASKVHSLLDPKRVAGANSPFRGTVMRECAISDEHPRPTPIVIGLDVTGSNGPACYATHKKLPKLFGALQQCVSDPEIMMAAVGDANCDRFPLQVGNFESDNRVDDQIAAIILENGGGGQQRETYELLAYFLVNHTVLRSWQEQQRKGYVFFIGDEMPYRMVYADQVRRVIGDSIGEDLSTKEVFQQLQEQYNVYFLFQEKGSYTAEQILPDWRELLGERALVLRDPENVCEFIAGIVSLNEGDRAWEDIAEGLRGAGFDDKAIDEVLTLDAAVLDMPDVK